MTPEEYKKLKRMEKKLYKGFAQLLKDEMSTEQKIQMLNTPYNELPDALKYGMTKRPQKFKFIKMKNPNIGEQRETFAARLIRYRDKYHLTPKKFCEICEEYGREYGTKITLHDISNYENYNVCPKIDKMTLISLAMNVSLDYLAGYGPDSRPGTGPKPLSPTPLNVA